jgi:predicted AlkP superfamily phosphohydrolase/phosphomutase
MTSANGRLFVFGWDGADWTVVREAWRRGRLPALRRIAENGQSGSLLSTIPAVTPTAWTSFLTGRSPGVHGIFGFRSIDPDTYRMHPLPGGARRAPILMRGLDAHGYRTCLLTVPWTYPPDELSIGAIVPGWDAPDEGLESCHPPHVGQALAEVVPRVPRRGPARLADRRTVLEHQAETIDLRERMAAHLIDSVDPQVFMMVFMETDQASHRLWVQPEVPEGLLDSYELVDRAMERILQRFAREGDRILVLSDHGSQPLHTYVHLGPILKQGGWLAMAGRTSISHRTVRMLKEGVYFRLPARLRNRAFRSLPGRVKEVAYHALQTAQIDWERTRAFPMGDETSVGGVYLNCRPPFSRGPVRPDDYERTREDLMASLWEVIDPRTGSRVFARVERREDVYSGPATSTAPDVVVVPEDGYGVRSGLDLSARLSQVAMGGHRGEGMYAFSEADGLGGVERLDELFPKVLSASGFPVDGSTDQPGEAPTEYSEREAREIESRLRDLGYLE